MQKSFKENVLKVVSDVQAGETLSYKEVAALSGNPHAARAVGMILKNNEDLNIPCHRVIRSNGKLGGYNGLRGIKKSLLIAEGVGGWGD